MAEKTISRLAKTVVYPYITGFCNAGGHEGSMKLSKGGALIRACSGEYKHRDKRIICSCTCHEDFREIQRITGLTTQSHLISPLILDDPPAKETEVPTDAPTNEDTPDMATVGLQETLPPTPMTGVSSFPNVAWNPAKPGDTPGELVPGEADFPKPSVLISTSFQPTATGRRAKGELEFEVLTFLRNWFSASGTTVPGAVACTPKLISEKLGGPSLGAIDAILKRFEKSGRLTLAMKPTRVESFR